MRPAATLVMLAALLLGAWSFDATGRLGMSAVRTSSASGWPEPPTDRQDSRVAPAVEVADEAISYRFAATQPDDDAPVRYDPCAPIHLVVNPRTIFDGGSRLLAEAVDEVQDATGLVITIDGLTDESPSRDRSPLTDDESAWRPVLVAWSDPDEAPELRGQVAGVGGSSSVVRDGRRWYVSGVVSLDGPQLARMLEQDRGRAAVRAVVMHELAHLVGLGHVDDSEELMHPEGRPGTTRWGPGDQTGLAAVGRGRCASY